MVSPTESGILLVPSSEANTCECNEKSSGENQTLRLRHGDSFQRPLALTQINAAYDFQSYPDIYRRKVNPPRPPDYLRSLSTIILII